MEQIVKQYGMAIFYSLVGVLTCGMFLGVLDAVTRA